MTELSVLQAVRLKGRANAEAVVAATGDPQAPQVLEDLLGRGLVKGGPAFRVTPEGREHLAGLVAHEREQLDTGALSAAYAEFDEHNDALKAVVTSWQMKAPDVPNDHSDEAYDTQVVAALADVDTAFRPLLDRLVALAPRLAPYPGRFSHALQQAVAGDRTWIARPVMDSYHTVWFELHEELIGLLGLSRADEALAGRAV